MAVFEIEIPEVHYLTVLVEAADEKDAISKYENGYGYEEVSVEYSHTLDSDKYKARKTNLLSLQEFKEKEYYDYV